MHITLESIVQYATLGTLLIGLVSLVVWARIYRRQVNTQILLRSRPVTRSFGPFPRHYGPGLTPVSRYPSAMTSSQRTLFSTSRCWSLRMFSTSGDILRTIYGPSCGLNINEQERIPCLNASGTWSRSNLRCTRILSPM